MVFFLPSFWMGGGLESRCVGRVYGADCAVRLTLNFPQDLSLKNHQFICHITRHITGRGGGGVN